MTVKKILTTIGLLTAFITIPLVLLYINESYEIRKRAFVEGGAASLSILPLSGTFSPGDEVEVNINYDTGGKDVYGVEAAVQYNSDVFEPVGDSADLADSDFPTVIRNNITEGNIQLVLTIPIAQGNSITGTGNVAKVKLQVKGDAPNGNTSVEIQNTSGIFQSSDWEDILGTINNATYNITAGGNIPPTAEISQPTDGATFDPGDPIPFQGTGTDDEDGTLTGNSLVWTSNVDGQIGTGEDFEKDNLSAGEHTITLTAADSNGATGTDNVTITLAEPTAQLDHVTLKPASPTGTVSQTQIFTARGFDNQNAVLVNFENFNATWSIEGDIGTLSEDDSGRLPISEAVSTATFTAADTAGTGTVTVVFEIDGITKEASADVTVSQGTQPLTCSISENDFSLQPGQQKNLTAVTEGGTDPISYQWSAEKGSFDDALSRIPIWEAPPTNVSHGEEIQIQLTAEGDEGNTCQDTVKATITTQTATLTISYELQGRDAPQTDLLHIFAREKGTEVGYENAPWKTELEAETDTYGRGVIHEIELDTLNAYSEKTYEVFLKSNQHLQVRGEPDVVLERPNLYAIQFPTMNAGDLTGDNVIDTLDISIWIEQAFQEGAETADINRDGVVDALDISLILSNFDKHGNE